MEKERKTVDELLEELGWSWLPVLLGTLFVVVYFIVDILD
jgi:hypothetical protein